VNCFNNLYVGLEPQAKEVPFRFLVKQLLVEKNRVIFTGTDISVYGSKKVQYFGQ